MFKSFVQDIKYTTKLIRGIVSGYDGLQVQFCDEWEYVPHSLTTQRNRYGKHSGEFEFTDMPDNPYYVCATWNNGSHLPLPLVLDANGEYPIQNALIKLLHKLYPSRWREAFYDCAIYENQWCSAEDWQRNAAMEEADQRFIEGADDEREYLGEEILKKLRDATLEF